jgi:hypothetical protein
VRVPLESLRHTRSVPSSRLMSSYLRHSNSPCLNPAVIANT